MTTYLDADLHLPSKSAALLSPQHQRHPLPRHTSNPLPAQFPSLGNTREGRRHDDLHALHHHPLGRAATPGGLDPPAHRPGHCRWLRHATRRDAKDVSRAEAAASATPALGLWARMDAALWTHGLRFLPGRQRGPLVAGLTGNGPSHQAEPDALHHSARPQPRLDAPLLRRKAPRRGHRRHRRPARPQRLPGIPVELRRPRRLPLSPALPRLAELCHVSVRRCWAPQWLGPFWQRRQDDRQDGVVRCCENLSGY